MALLRAAGVARGRRPLLVCFNRSLMEKIRANIPPGGLVQTWNGLCAKLRELIVGEDVPDDWIFDTLIVDEGQDFEPEWIEPLRLFLTDNHEAIWLEDRDQAIRLSGGVALDGFVGFRARWNYRTPVSIANQFGSPGRRQTGIIVGGHSVPSPETDSFATISFVGTDRMDRLLRDHT